jgi:FSR family fosmidomycin resistance protein-like MFS transporter
MAKRDNTLLGVSIGHAAHDSWYGLAPVLLAALSVSMHLSNSDIALILLFYQALSSISQPIFGRWSERWGGRPFAVGSILWTTLMFSASLFMQDKIGLMVCIGLAGFGSGAWHPQGTTNATVSGGERWGATSTAIFFLGGTLGSAYLGAAMGGWLLEAFDRRSLLILSAIAATIALTVVRRTVPQRLLSASSTSARSAQAGNGTTGRTFYVLLAVLLAGIAMRSLTFTSLTTFVSKYQQDLGASPATYGVLMSVFLTTTAVGGVIGSYLADRLGLQRVLAGSLLISSGLLVLFLRTTGFGSYASFALLGLIFGPSHTLFLVAGQRQFPTRMAMMAGVFLGFTFVSGAGGAWVLGLLADRIGLGTMLGVLPWALVGALAATLVGVPRGLPRRDPQPEEAIAV